MHLLMFFPFETLTHIIWTGLPILVELISNDLTQTVNFPTWITDYDSHGPALLDLFLTFDASICSTWLSLHREILIILLSQFPLTFHHIHNKIPFNRIAYYYSHAD